jgi:hypothetical protein
MKEAIECGAGKTEIVRWSSPHHYKYEIAPEYSDIYAVIDQMDGIIWLDKCQSLP